MRTKVTILQELRRRWIVYAVMGVIWALAIVRVFADPTPRVPLLYNKTGSMPYTFAYVRYGQRTYTRGDLVIYSFDGQAQKFFPGLRHQPFFKRVRGLPGDRITVRGREVFINGESVGLAAQYGPKRVVLDPIEEGVIPDGYLYMQGVSNDSFDSRYKLSGLIRKDQILAGVVPIF